MRTLCVYIMLVSFFIAALFFTTAFFVYLHVTRLRDQEAKLELIKNELAQVQQLQQILCRAIGNELKNWGRSRT